MHISSLLANDQSRSTRSHAAKSVCFELLLDDRSKTRARIPLRVLVNTHDTTESIMTTVKSFYGIYDGNGVSFQDAAGNTLIPSYDNFNHDTTVYVRSVAGQAQPAQPVANGQESPPRPTLGEPFSMLPPRGKEHSQSPTRRSSSRNISKRSVSPCRDRGRRSNSQQQRGSHADSRNSSAHGSYRDNDLSDSDAGQSSISGSRKARSEQFASSEISAANVLLDGRRGQPIFDSSVRQCRRPLCDIANNDDRHYRYSLLLKFRLLPRNRLSLPKDDHCLAKGRLPSRCQRRNATAWRHHPCYHHKVTVPTMDVARIATIPAQRRQQTTVFDTDIRAFQVVARGLASSQRRTLPLPAVSRTKTSPAHS